MRDTEKINTDLRIEIAAGPHNGVWEQAFVEGLCGVFTPNKIHGVAQRPLWGHVVSDNNLALTGKDCSVTCLVFCSLSDEKVQTSKLEVSAIGQALVECMRYVLIQHSLDSRTDREVVEYMLQEQVQCRRAVVLCLD